MDSIPSNLTVKELEEAGAPGVSALKKWFDSAKGAGNAMARAKMHAAAAGNGLRQGGESLLVGGLLGAASVHLKGGLDQKKIPIDGVIGVLGIVGGAAMAHEEFGKDLTNAGAAALSVMSFRKSQLFLAEKARAAGKTPGFEVHGDDDEGFVHGDFGAEDPVVAAARFL